MEVDNTAMFIGHVSSICTFNKLTIKWRKSYKYVFDNCGVYVLDFLNEMHRYIVVVFQFCWTLNNLFYVDIYKVLKIDISDKYPLTKRRDLE